MKYLFTVVLCLMAQTCMGQKITVSDQVPMPVRYPAAIYQMSDEEFFDWAVNFNQKQKAAVETRRARLVEEQRIYGYQTQREHSYNYYRSGESGDATQRTTVYPVQRPNPYYTGPGPLIIVNPYCRPTK